MSTFAFAKPQKNDSKIVSIQLQYKNGEYKTAELNTVPTLMSRLKQEKVQAFVKEISCQRPIIKYENVTPNILIGADSCGIFLNHSSLRS